MLAVPSSDTYESFIVKIIRTLPPERVAQLADYARYLQGRMVEFELDEETEAEIEADEARWDRQFAASEELFTHTAAKVREEINAGRTTEMKLTADGRIEPA